MKCRECGTEFEGNFCPNCGTRAIDDNDGLPAVPANPSKPTVTLVFKKSTSKNYPLAVERAMKLSTYSEKVEGKEIIHSVDFTLAQAEELRDLLDLVGDWKSTALYINHQQMPYKDVRALIYCYAERQRAYNPKEYCFGRDDADTWNDNDLGCRHCGVNPYQWRGLSEFGLMQRDGTFVVDKNKLIYTVARNLEPYMLCPALDVEAVKKRIEQIPEKINPKTNRGWEYVTDWMDGKEVAVAVRKKRRGHGYVLKDYSQSLHGSDEDTEPVIEAGSKARTAQASSCLGCILPVICIMGIIALALFIF